MAVLIIHVVRLPQGVLLGAGQRTPRKRDTPFGGGVIREDLTALVTV